MIGNFSPRLHCADHHPLVTQPGWVTGCVTQPLRRRALNWRKARAQEVACYVRIGARVRGVLHMPLSMSAELREVQGWSVARLCVGGGALSGALYSLFTTCVSPPVRGRGVGRSCARK